MAGLLRASAHMLPAELAAALATGAQLTAALCDGASDAGLWVGSAAERVWRKEGRESDQVCGGAQGGGLAAV